MGVSTHMITRVGVSTHDHTSGCVHTHGVITWVGQTIVLQKVLDEWVCHSRGGPSMSTSMCVPRLRDPCPDPEEPSRTCLITGLLSPLPVGAWGQDKDNNIKYVTIVRIIHTYVHTY